MKKEPPYAFEMVVHKYDGTAETIVRVAKSPRAAERAGMMRSKAESVLIVGGWTREEYHRVYGRRSVWR